MRRIHITDKPLGKLVKRKQKIESKPLGLWYSADDEWFEWCKAENFRHYCEPSSIKYNIEIDEDKILKIKGLYELKELTKEFGAECYPGQKTGQYPYVLNWPLIAEEYSGIEIIPYIWAARYDFVWYYGWDVASGCIWDPKAIKNIEEI